MFITVKLDDIQNVAQKLVSLLGNAKTVAFHGEMGAGKTTLIKAVCECMGCVDVVNSPTFSIINEYFTKDGATIYHFDFYRLKNIHEALDLGAGEYFHSGHLCLMEWMPEQIKPLLPDNHIDIYIENGNTIPSFFFCTIQCFISIYKEHSHVCVSSRNNGIYAKAYCYIMGFAFKIQLSRFHHCTQFLCKD